ncbi:hypothetical protein [Paenibacillus sp. FJAT-26967]|uniref:hypothetical protein n=1 Tax=Paenibacillus sp. FJAT-26967 TaxID=1729690 RepID=UPI000AD97018|nr:hypothetical protein [Paenibacillus sp. FJAT-26967]
MINPNNIYRIADVSGFTPQIGRLLSMTNYARHTTIQAVEGLGPQELDSSKKNPGIED